MTDHDAAFHPPLRDPVRSASAAPDLHPGLNLVETRIAMETLRCDCHGKWTLRLRLSRGRYHAIVPPQAAFSPIATLTFEDESFTNLCTRVISYHDALHGSHEVAA